MAFNKNQSRRGGGGGGGFKYRPRTAEDVKEQAEQSAGNFDGMFKSGFDLYKPEEGENVVRFCPPTWSGARSYTYEIWVHYNVGPRNGSYLCLKKMLNKRCPCCETADEAKRHGEKEDSDKLQAKKGRVGWVMDRDDEKSSMPKLWRLGWTVDSDIGSILTDRKTGQVLQIDDPDNGYDISFKRRGKDINTKYSGFQVDRDPSPLLDKQRDQDDVIDFVQANPIPETLKYYKAEYLEDLLSGAAGEDDDEDDDDPDNEENEDMVERARSSRGSGGRSRDRGEEDERDAPRRGRGREEDRGARKGRGRDEEPDDRGARRGRGRVEEEPEDRGTRRGRGRETPEDDPPEDDEYNEDQDDEAGDDDPVDEEDRRPRTARGKSARGGKDEPDDEPDDEADDDEADDEPDERPARSSRDTGKQRERSAGKTTRGRNEKDDPPSRSRRPPPRDQGKSKTGKSTNRR